MYMTEIAWVSEGCAAGAFCRVCGCNLPVRISYVGNEGNTPSFSLWKQSPTSKVKVQLKHFGIYFFSSPKLWVWNRSQGSILAKQKHAKKNVCICASYETCVPDSLFSHRLDFRGLGMWSVWASKDLPCAPAKCFVAIPKLQLPINSFPQLQWFYGGVLSAVPPPFLPHSCSQPPCLAKFISLHEGMAAFILLLNSSQQSSL